MNRPLSTSLTFAVVIAGIHLAVLPSVRAADADVIVTRIGFGSCAHQKHEQVIWDAVAAARPDVFVMLGDNVYADTEDMDHMRATYAQLAAKPGFQNARSLTTMLATWDDHDYGRNDAGADYPMKGESRRVFLEFWGRAGEIDEPGREGIYSSRVFGPEGRRVQVILLDTRSFRSALDQRIVNGRKTYFPVRGGDVTMLGGAQWAWLADRLREPADVRVLASSIQVVPEEHPWEKWANMPDERDRLFRLLAETGARNLVIISGDRHLAELSQLDGPPADFPVFEATSSALTMSGGGSDDEPNRHRVAGGNFRKNNFGMILIDWSGGSPAVTLEIRDEEGVTVRSQPVAW